jgi:hypothetical protein
LQLVKAKLVRDKENHYILVKETIHQEDIIIANPSVKNIGAPNFIRQTLQDIKGEISPDTK